MKKILFFTVFLLAAASAGAETIYLKSGVTATGKIVDQNDTSVVIDIGGATVTYYKDEIDHMDQGALAVPAKAPAVEVSAPVPAPVAVPAPEPATQPVISGGPLAGSGPLAGPGSISQSKHDLIMRFVDVFGTRASMKANFDQMMTSLGPDEAAKLRNAFNVEEIIEQLVPLYDKYFTESDLTAYVNFYGSADGKKLVSAIPQIMRGSVDISARYFEAHMPEEFKKGLEPKADASQK